MTEHARAVIIGGGVGGTSIAYHLAELGWTDIVLLDRAELTSGSTFHSAGLVGQLRGSVTLTRMMMYGVDLYRRLAAETGVDPSWREVGSLRLASTTARYEELQRQAGWAKTFGLPLDLITAKEAQDRPCVVAKRPLAPEIKELPSRRQAHTSWPINWSAGASPMKLISSPEPWIISRIPSPSRSATTGEDQITCSRLPLGKPGSGWPLGSRARSTPPRVNGWPIPPE